jgi:hypothetical protein
MQAVSKGITGEPKRSADSKPSHSRGGNDMLCIIEEMPYSGIPKLLHAKLEITPSTSSDCNTMGSCYPAAQ